MKKRFLRFAILICFISLVVCAGVFGAGYVSGGVNYEVDHESAVVTSPVNYGDVCEPSNASTGTAATEGTIVNVVIFISFSDSDAWIIGDEAIKKFNGDNASLRDYYYTMTCSKLSVNSVFAVENVNGKTVYVNYVDSKPRSYYLACTDKTGSKRYSLESSLLNNAVSFASDKINYSGMDLDTNDDNYVDSVSFILYGDSSGNWGTLLWPHSWQLDTISREVSPTNRSSTLNNIRVQDYSFNFYDRLTVGLLCHEMGHVLGLNDLYHYNYDTSYLPVGGWDLMHYQNDIPQYLLTYSRFKYLNAFGEARLNYVRESELVTLKSVNRADANDVLACVIDVSGSDDSIWIEYRSNKDTYVEGGKSFGSYDSELEGSGLIVYRVNSRAAGKGNVNGRNQSVLYPDEVYVYRPSVSAASSVGGREKENLEYAYLSKNNTAFSSLGSTAATTSKYKSGEIYLTDGTNSGLVVNIREESDESITFNVTVPSTKNYIIDSVKIAEQDVIMPYGKDLKDYITFMIKYADTNDYVYAGKQNITIEYDKNLVGIKQQAVLTYEDNYNAPLTYKFYVTISDVLSEVGILNLPDVTVYEVGANLNTTGLYLSVKYANRTINIDDTDERLTFQGFSGVRHGEYLITVTFTDDVLKQSATTCFTVWVKASVLSIKYSEVNSKIIVRQGETPVLNVVGVLNDGTERAITADEYDIVGYDPSDCNRWQTVSVELKTKEYVLNNIRIWVIGSDRTVNNVVLVSAPTQIVYRYGQKLELAGGSVQLTINGDENGPTIPLNAFYDVFSAKYSSTVTGRKTLTASVFGKEVSFVVSVNSRQNDLLHSSDDAIKINVSDGTVILDKTFTLSEFSQKLDTYLTIVYTYDGTIVTPYTYPDVTVGKTVGIQLYNGATDSAVISFVIRLRGDANDDGKVDKLDYETMAELILKRDTSAKAYQHLDLNGDGVFDIIDFAIAVERTEGRNG